MVLPNLEPQGQTRAQRRLREESVVWLTTVNGDGQPQSSPVGFLWHDGYILILSQPRAPKVRNIRGNPKVALHLELERDPADGGVLTVEGTAALAATLTDRERTAYLERFREQMVAGEFEPAEVFEEFSAVIRVTPTRTRMY